MKVLLETGVWIADVDGDPGRTLQESYAQEFETMEKAKSALKAARKYRPFLSAEIQEDFI